MEKNEPVKKEFAETVMACDRESKLDQELRSYLRKRIDDYCRGKLCNECDVRETCYSGCPLSSELPTSKLQEIYFAMYPDMKPKNPITDEEYERAKEIIFGDQKAKTDAGKPIFTWVPPAIIRAIERVRAFGNKKYHDPDNWRQVSPDRYWQAYLRHTIAAWWNFRKRDKESGLRHIDHCACNLAFIMQFLEDEELELPDDGLHCKHCLYFDEDEHGEHCSECKYAYIDNFVRRTHD